MLCAILKNGKPPKSRLVALIKGPLVRLVTEDIFRAGYLSASNSFPIKIPEHDSHDVRVKTAKLLTSSQEHYEENFVGKNGFCTKSQNTYSFFKSMKEI